MRPSEAGRSPPGIRIAVLALALVVLGPPLATAQDLVGLYLTWPDDPTTGMVVNWVNLYPRHADTVWWRADGAMEWRSVQAHHSQLEPSSLQLRRAVLGGLEPGRTYTFGIGSKPGPEQGWRFRTMPARLERPLRFVAGGDMLHERPTLDRMNRQAAALDPDFALLGGDLAYDNGEAAGNWIDWLGSWMKSAVAADRRLVPIVAAIGNHEVRGGYRGRPVKDSPYYYALFIPPGGRSYFAADVGDYLSLIVLDTGHTEQVEGPQSEWLARALAERDRQRFVFVTYHFPAYGTVKAVAGKLPPEHPKAVEIQTHWLPHLERHGVTAVFEHDHHACKRSHRILAGARDDENGLLFLGDGAWGVPPRQIPVPKTAWWLARAESRGHVWCIDVRPDGTALARAIDERGEAFDEVAIEEPRTRPVAAAAAE